MNLLYIHGVIIFIAFLLDSVTLKNYAVDFLNTAQTGCLKQEYTVINEMMDNMHTKY